MTDLIDAIADATGRFSAAVDAHPDLTTPSRLPDWSVAHVVAHVVLNAEAFVLVASGRRAGRVGIMYPDGVDGRARAIDDLAQQPAEVLGTRLAAASAAFTAAWSEPVPEGPCCTAVGLNEFVSSTVPLRRLREVEVHGADTGIAALAPAAWSDTYVGLDLPEQWTTVARRTTEPVAVVDDEGARWSANDVATAVAVRATRRQLLAWILDREEVVGLPPLAPWGDQSRWNR